MWSRSLSPVLLLAALAALASVAPACSREGDGQAGAAAALSPPEPSNAAATDAQPARASAVAAQPAAEDASSPVAPSPEAVREPEGASASAPGVAPDERQALSASAIPDIVARIDGVPITKVELLARAVEARGALAERGTPMPVTTRAFYRRVLDDLIGNRLLHRDLAARSKEATAEEVAARMQAIRAQFSSDEELDRLLEQRGFTREMLERELVESATVHKWVTQDVQPTVSVGEDEIRAYYDAHPDEMVEPERVHARHILLRVEAQASAEQRAARRHELDEIRRRIRDGEEFATLARSSSEDRLSAERGGDLGWFYRGQMVPAFERAAFALAPGQLSEPVETRFGYHVIEVLEKRPETSLAFEQIKDRLAAILEQRRLEEKVRDRINELGSAAEVEILL